MYFDSCRWKTFLFISKHNTINSSKNIQAKNVVKTKDIAKVILLKIGNIKKKITKKFLFLFNVFTFQVFHIFNN